MADEKYLPISNAMGRDIDSGKAASKDLADFLPDSVAQELYDQTTANRGPVHAENLIPISREQGTDLRRIDPAAGTLPRFPSTRRVIPAPYKRDRAVGGSHGKAWTLVLAGKIVAGDIITDIGLVTAVQERMLYGTVSDFTGQHGDQPADAAGQWAAGDKVATGTEYVVTGAGGRIVAYPASAEVKVFRGRSS